MRLPFSDSDRIREEAKRNVDSGLAQMKRWWVQKYKLPPNHLLFQNQSFTALNLEMMEDLWMRERELSEKTETEEGSVLNEAHAQLQDVRKALGLVRDFAEAKVTGSDPLVDQWERDIAAGRVPDLDREVADG